VLFPSFDFNIFVDLRCGVSVFYGRWFSTVFLTVPVLVPPKGFVARSFFAFDFIHRATPVFAGRILSGRADRDREPRPHASAICPIVLGLCPIITWLSQVSVRSCRVSVRSSLDSARSLSDRHLAQPDLCPIVSGLCPIVIWLSQIYVRSSFGSAWSLSDHAGSLSDCHFALAPSSCGVSLARFIL
jgi:hypothetical protein